MLLLVVVISWVCVAEARLDSTTAISNNMWGFLDPHPAPVPRYLQSTVVYNDLVVMFGACSRHK